MTLVRALWLLLTLWRRGSANLYIYQSYQSEQLNILLVIKSEAFSGLHFLLNLSDWFTTLTERGQHASSKNVIAAMRLRKRSTHWCGCKELKVYSLNSYYHCHFVNLPFMSYFCINSEVFPTIQVLMYSTVQKSCISPHFIIFCFQGTRYSCKNSK